MQKRLQIKTNAFFNKFKNDIKDEMNKLNLKPGDSNKLLQFVYDYSNIDITKEDFLKRKRVKNSVPWHDRCCALKAEGVQCTRRRKDSMEFCGTHLKGTPHGIVNNDKPVEDKLKKISVFSQEIDGIIYHLDDSGNIYDPQDIHENIENPKVIAKYSHSPDGQYSIMK